jgi:hypothetical protein
LFDDPQGSPASAVDQWELESGIVLMPPHPHISFWIVDTLPQRVAIIEKTHIYIFLFGI